MYPIQNSYLHTADNNTIHQRLQSSSSSSTEESNHSYNINVKSKRRESLEKNRMAAYRCRERKKHEQKQMIDQADYLTVQNETLHHMVNGLKNEVISLRELLLAHDTCDCERVQMFIRRSSSCI
ncbi:unnamed protein product [Mucor hiemalis]